MNIAIKIKLWLKANWQLLIVLLMVILAYSNIFSNEFVGDDLEFIVNWPATRSWDNWESLLQGELPARVVGVYRPVRSGLYLIMYQIFGLNSWAYHGFSLTIHLSGVILAYLIGKELFKNSKAAGMVALWFGLHPVQVEAITYITASFDTAGMVIALGSFWCFLNALKFKSKKQNRWLTAGVFTAGIAFLTNEISMALPFVVSWYGWLSEVKGFYQDKSRLKLIASYWIALLIVLGWRFGVMQINSRGDYINSSLVQTMMVSAKAVVRYVELAVWPVDLNLTHEVDAGIRVSEMKNLVDKAVMVQSWWSYQLWLAVLLIGGIVIMAMKLKPKQPVVALGLGWFLIGLLPVSNLIPSASFVSERYLYFSIFGYCLIWGWLLSRVKLHSKRKSWLVLTILAITVGYSGITYNRNSVWRNKLSLWSDTARKNPENSWAQFKLGEAYQNNELLDEAEMQYSLALKLNPEFPLAYRNLAMVYEVRGEIDSAETNYLKAVRIPNSDGEVIQSLVDFYYRTGKPNLARQYIK